MDNTWSVFWRFSLSWSLKSNFLENYQFFDKGKWHYLESACNCASFDIKLVWFWANFLICVALENFSKLIFQNFLWYLRKLNTRCRMSRWFQILPITLVKKLIVFEKKWLFWSAKGKTSKHNIPFGHFELLPVNWYSSCLYNLM